MPLLLCFVIELKKGEKYLEVFTRPFLPEGDSGESGDSGDSGESV